jgi:calcium-dependent protein kinase
MGICFSGDKEGAQVRPDGGSDSDEEVALHRLLGTAGKFDASKFVVDNPGSITDFYVLDKKLGEGTYGTVCKGVNKSTNQIRAIKSIAKTSMQDKNLKRFQQEIRIMKSLDHPNIVKLFETFEDGRNIYLVMELCQGGELFDRILAEGHFSEKQAAELMKQILGCIYYLHENGYMHRDLKPENFLFMENNKPIEGSTLKIIDFGLSCPFKKGQKMKTKAGTPYYVSPQVLEGNYDQACDVWSCGVIMYIMLCGYPPFYGDSDQEVLQRVRSGNYKFDATDWGKTSSDATDLIKGMLKKNVSERLTAKQCFTHTWIKEKAPRAPDVRLPANLLQKMGQFRGGNKLKKSGIACDRWSARR